MATPLSWRQQVLISKRFALDPAGIQAYYSRLSPSDGGDEESKLATNKGVSAALAMLNLEYLYEVVENKSFHKQLVRAIDQEPNGTQHIQELFVTIFDHLLQLIATVSALTGDQERRRTSRKTTAGEEDMSMTIALGTHVMELSLPAFGHTIYGWCLDILKAMHKLLDTAAFVSILQELVGHEQAPGPPNCLVYIGSEIRAHELWETHQWRRAVSVLGTCGPVT